jgi:lipopolysaccharide transport system permease protein
MQPAPTIVIEPRRGLAFPRLGEIWEYRDLLWLFIRRDLVARYQQTVLGPLWFALQPVLMAILFSIIFSRVAGIGTAGVPPILFYLAGLAGWSYFAQNLTSTAGIFSAHASMFSKVYFPRMLVPLSTTLSNLGGWVVQVITFIVIAVIYSASGVWVPARWPWEAVFWLPALAVYTAMLSLGVNLWLISLSVKYRDLTQVFHFMAQLWFFATPVIYPLSGVSPRWRDFFLLNPMTPVVESCRYALLGVGEVWVEGWMVSATVAGLVFITGAVLFDRAQRTLVDTV